MRVNESVISPFRKVDQSTLASSGARTRVYVSHGRRKIAARQQRGIIYSRKTSWGATFYLHALTALQPHTFSELHAVTWM